MGESFEDRVSSDEAQLGSDRKYDELNHSSWALLTIPCRNWSQTIVAESVMKEFESYRLAVLEISGEFCTLSIVQHEQAAAITNKQINKQTCI